MTRTLIELSFGKACAITRGFRSSPTAAQVDQNHLGPLVKLSTGKVVIKPFLKRLAGKPFQKRFMVVVQ